jgi:hypothetical protein
MWGKTIASSGFCSVESIMAYPATSWGSLKELPSMNQEGTSCRGVEENEHMLGEEIL